jgi:2-keto-4-pentenoate hydratase
VHASGSVNTIVTNLTTIPVVPRQKLRVSGYMKANAVFGPPTIGAQFLLFTSADGAPEYLQTGTTTTTGSLNGVVTAYSPMTADFTIPAGAFVARIGLKITCTAANTVWWDEIVVTEVIS